MLRQEFGQVPGYRWISGIRQAEFLEPALSALRWFVQPHRWKESIQQSLVDLRSSKFDLNRTGQQLRSFARDVDRVAFRTRIGQHRLFDTSGRLYQSVPLHRGQRSIGLACLKLRFGLFGNRQIHVVAAEDQMPSHSDAMKLHLISRLARWLDSDQSQVGCSAPDVTNQNQLAGADQVLPVVTVPIDPGVKGGLRFLNQVDSPQPRL